MKTLQREGERNLEDLLRGARWLLATRNLLEAVDNGGKNASVGLISTMQ